MRSRAAWFVRVLVLAMMGAAVLPLSAKSKPPAAKTPPVDRVWPPPPQKARFKLLQIMGGEADVVVRKKMSLLSRLVADNDAPNYIHFRRPHGIAGDRQGRLYVTDTYLRALFVIDPQLRTFKVFAADNDYVTLRQPLGVAVDSQDRVWIADSSLASVLCFSPDEKLLLQFGHDVNPAPATAGSKESPKLVRPTGVALDERRQRVYVSDSKSDQIVVFNTEGHYLNRFGKLGGAPGNFFSPGALQVDAKGNIYVADTLNARVQIFDPDFHLIRVIGSRCDHPGCFARPKGIALDSKGHLYVSDSWFHNLQIFGHDPRVKDPQALTVLMFIGEGGTKPGEFQGPGGIYINRFDQIFVADQLNGRIQVLQYLDGGEE